MWKEVLTYIIILPNKMFVKSKKRCKKILSQRIDNRLNVMWYDFTCVYNDLHFNYIIYIYLWSYDYKQLRHVQYTILKFVYIDCCVRIVVLVIILLLWWLDTQSGSQRNKIVWIEFSTLTGPYLYIAWDPAGLAQRFSNHKSPMILKASPACTNLIQYSQDWISIHKVHVGICNMNVNMEIWYSTENVT